MIRNPMKDSLDNAIAQRTRKPEKKTMTEEELFKLLDEEHHGLVRGWMDRGDGVAVYRNQAMDSANLGHRQFVSYGSAKAQLEMEEPPQRLPDLGSKINWAYQLEAAIQRTGGEE